jgi:hypothetical protein
MVRPVNFGFNEQTAGSNTFQIRNSVQQQVQANALQEFDKLVDVLTSSGVDVITVDDTPEPHTPDSIFPNNWVSFHSDGHVYLYPMQAENRRLERREDIITGLEDQFSISQITDLSRYETEGKFLEGTGSMVLDRKKKIAYACLSPRTDRELLQLFCEQEGYVPVVFHAADENGIAIYHTNVLMCVGSKFVVICLECIPDPQERAQVETMIQLSGKEIIPISFDQMNHFAGNMLELRANDGSALLVMSESAYRSLEQVQIVALESYAKLLHSDISTIEQNGGGSARCMIAEVHLPHAHL